MAPRKAPASAADPRDVNRRVDFKEAGAGIYLKLRNSGARELHATLGKNWSLEVERDLLVCDIAMVEKCLSLMAFRGDEKIDIAIDDLDHIPLNTLGEKLLDAFTISLTGRTYPEQIAWLKQQEKELRAAENPPTKTTPEAPLDGAREPPTEPV